MDIQPWQTRPIFITSTFRDMQAERDYLHGFVFPELAQRLRERFCHLEPIDLRWGVETVDSVDEQAREMLVLKVCLDEVKRCRPFLIALLGDRYGWTPPVARMKLAAQEAGFEQDVSHKSVTELEIEFGVMNSTEQKRRSFFYFREPLPYAEMDPAVAADYSERYRNEPEKNSSTARLGRRVARWFVTSSNQDNKAAKRLELLKARIQQQMPEQVRSYTACWDQKNNKVTDLESFGTMVLEDLWSILSKDVAEASEQHSLSWQAVERQLLEQFIESRAHGFVGRTELLKTLMDHAHSPAGEGEDENAAPWGLSITGEAGSGKSALFAKLQRELQAAARQGELLLLSHAAGVSPASGQVDSMLRRWVEELGSALGIRAPLADDADTEELEKTFHRLLRQACVKQRVLICIDALNQFDDNTRAAHLTWLPSSWPANARLITTAIPGIASKALAERDGVHEERLAQLSECEARDIAITICQRYHRTLNPGVLRALLDKTLSDDSVRPSSGNALWLELAIEQLNLLDADDFARADRDFTGEADTRLIQLMRDVVNALPSDAPGLYAWLLRRAEKLHGKPLAESLATLIAVSRNGWRDSDLRPMILAVMGVPKDQWDKQWDALNFAALKRTYRAHLVQKGSQGQWDFNHTQMREAVACYYLDDQEKARSLHGLIADHLEQLPAEDPAHESEIMFHYIGADDQLSAARYYGESALTLGEEFCATESLAEYINDQSGSVIGWIAGLPELTSLSTAEQHRLCHRFHCELIFSVNQLNKRHSLAEAACSNLERLCQPKPAAEEWLWDLRGSYSHIGDILRDMGRAPEALDAYHAAEYPGGQNLDESAILNDRVGDILRSHGDLPAALIAYRSALTIRKSLFQQNPEEPGWLIALSASHQKTGLVLESQGKLAEARDAFSAAQTLGERIVERNPDNYAGQHSLSFSYNRLGDIIQDQGVPSEALEAYRAALAIRERLLQRDPNNTEYQREISTNYERIGNALRDQSEYPAALKYYESSRRITAQLANRDPGNTGWQDDLAIAEEHIGNTFSRMRNFTAALPAQYLALTIREHLVKTDPNNSDWQSGLSRSHTNIGDTLYYQGNLKAALAYYYKALAIREQLAQHDLKNATWQRDLVSILSKLAETLEEFGSPDSYNHWKRARDIIISMQCSGISLSPRLKKLLQLIEMKFS